MNISNAQRARLGVFAVAGIAVLLVLVSISLGIKLTQRTKDYFAYFQGESLSGLEQGADVKYSGVLIGRVEKISYQPSDLSKVKITLRVQADFPMQVGMYVTTGLVGITGLKYVEILGGKSGAPPLNPGAALPTRESLFSSISGKAEAITAKVEMLINNLNLITNPDSLKSMRVMLDNVAAITGDVRTIVAGLPPKVDSMTSSAADITAKIDRIATNAQTITATFNKALNEGQIATAIGSIDSAALAIKQVSQNLSLVVMQSHEDFSVSMRNLREASENIDQLSQILVENPSLLLRNEAPKERSKE